MIDEETIIKEGFSVSRIARLESDSRLLSTHQYPYCDIYMLATQLLSGAIFSYKEKINGLLEGSLDCYLSQVYAGPDCFWIYHLPALFPPA